MCGQCDSTGLLWVLQLPSVLPGILRHNTRVLYHWLRLLAVLLYSTFKLRPAPCPHVCPGCPELPSSGRPNPWHPRCVSINARLICCPMSVFRLLMTWRLLMWRAVQVMLWGRMRCSTLMLWLLTTSREM